MDLFLLSIWQPPIPKIQNLNPISLPVKQVKTRWVQTNLERWTTSHLKMLLLLPRLLMILLPSCSLSYRHKHMNKIQLSSINLILCTTPKMSLYLQLKTTAIPILTNRAKRELMELGTAPATPASTMGTESALQAITAVL